MSGCNWMSDTVNVSTNTSTMDQRPMISTMRYSRTRCWLFWIEPRLMVMTRYRSATLFALGIMMLANSTISDSGQPVGDHRSTTPCMMVSDSLPPEVMVFITGSRLAGM